MSDQAPVTVTVPTELERSDGFVDLAVLFGTGLLIWWLAVPKDLGPLHIGGIALWYTLPLFAIIAVFTLTGEPAADVPYIGAVAAGLRSKLGLRRAHEWLLAYWHFFKVAQWPPITHALGERWKNSRLRSATRTRLPWLRWPSANGVRRLSRHVPFLSRS